eukprot:CAMPEP_0204010352 /NCGR_PEP_ID=MMETSP0360-20130528/22481_1 /ASSEMBLY_ACC=CAM_ASM_000342 /TAXON_ID=268821 /ORGANISM="Scrippsiella Hangoei, Strain SHTV-5" /LENGTH=115 /DNA_ID=CAMNT_0050952811 /DNA_START=170 /DNA_END=514 /DNA_ORIENTATION=-
MEAKADSNDTVLPLSTCSSLVAASGVGSKASRILTSRNLASTSTRGSGSRRSKSRTPLRTRASRFATTSRLTSPAAPPSPLGEDMEEDVDDDEFGRIQRLRVEVSQEARWACFLA